MPVAQPKRTQTLSEPTVERFHGKTFPNRLVTAIAATRPAFLTASVLPVLAAGALAAYLEHGAISTSLLALATLNIALIHSGANVLNDYFDAISGNDAANTGRVFPFSGGSRFIQNDVLSEAETLRLALMLLAAGALLGLGFVWMAGPMLLAIGALGSMLAIVYSAPPCLACRGFGDAVIAVCFGVLPVAGTTLILMDRIPPQAWWLGAGIACFVAAILWINSIPDIAADRAAGKVTLPARVGRKRAAQLLPAWFTAGFAILALSPLPSEVQIVLLAGVPAWLATRAALAGRLIPAMPLTIVTHAAVCLLLTAALLYAGQVRP